MKELNKKSLADAIRNLPDYEPKAGLWEQLQGDLEKGPVDSALQSAIEQLPEYSPSDALWDKIDSELGTKAKVVQFNKPMWLGIAASLLLLIGVLWALPSEVAAAEGTLAYSTEKIDNELLIKDWDADEDVFIMLKEVCSVRKLACTNPKVESLQTELAELNEARYMLKEAIGSYETDVDLLQELTDIELQRTSLAKEILQIIA